MSDSNASTSVDEWAILQEAREQPDDAVDVSEFFGGTDMGDLFETLTPTEIEALFEGEQ